MVFPDLDLTGQPAWVVVVVVAMIIGGGLGGIMLRKKPKDPPKRSSDNSVEAIQVVQYAMKHLAGVAEREAEESAGAHEEIKVLHQRLEGILVELANSRRALADCESQARKLASQVFQDGEK